MTSAGMCREPIMTARIFLGLMVFLAGCVRPTWPQPVEPEDDRSIVFPSFFEQPVVAVGAGGMPYELDGITLKALLIAMNDFLRPGKPGQPCWGSPEAHRYRIIRQEHIVFVRIDEDLEHCGLQYISVDSGVTYAISTDGRILRRVLEGEPAPFVAPSGAENPLEDGGVPDASSDKPAAPEHTPPVPSSFDSEDGGTSL